MMSVEPSFTLHLSVAPGPFFFNFPNAAYHGADHNGHLPTVVERRLMDLGDKYFLMLLASQKVMSIAQKIAERFEPGERELRVGEEYWELVLHLNHFLFEARSSLDILASVLHHLYRKHTPGSFNDIKIPGKHAKIFDEDAEFRDCLIEAKRSSWTHHLLSGSGQTSLRDRAAHFTVARVSILPDESGQELEYRITANLRAEHPMQPSGPELMKTITEVVLGMDKLLSGFRDNYTQNRIRTLLGVEPATPGAFEN